MLLSARPARRAPASLSAGSAGSPAGAELPVRGRFRGTAARDAHQALRSACSALSSERCLTGEGAPTPPATRGHPGAASAGPPAQHRRSRSAGHGGRWSPGAPRDSAGAKTTVPGGQRGGGAGLSPPGVCGKRRCGCRGSAGHHREASACKEQRAAGPLPASLHFSPAERGLEINPAARPAESEPGAGQKGDPALRAENMPAGGRRRGQERPPGLRGAQCLPPPQPQDTRLLCQGCWCRPQEEPGAPQEDHVPGNGQRLGAQGFERSLVTPESRFGEKKGAVLIKS